MVDFMIKECLFERMELGSILTRKEALCIRSEPCLSAHSQIGYINNVLTSISGRLRVNLYRGHGLHV